MKKVRTTKDDLLFAAMYHQLTHSCLISFALFNNELSDGTPRSHTQVFVFRSISIHSNFIKNQNHKQINVPEKFAVGK